jgi:hypothetical protein
LTSLRFGCNQTSPQCHQEAIATVNREREECRAIARVCGGGGNYSCFFPGGCPSWTRHLIRPCNHSLTHAHSLPPLTSDATATISNEYSFDISRGVVKTCDFFEFRRLADNTTRAASAPNTNPLPFSYAPLELAARPIAYSSDGGDTAQQSEVRHFLADQLEIDCRICASPRHAEYPLFTVCIFRFIHTLGRMWRIIQSCTPPSDDGIFYTFDHTLACLVAHS